MYNSTDVPELRLSFKELYSITKMVNKIKPKLNKSEGKYEISIMPEFDPALNFYFLNIIWANFTDHFVVMNRQYQFDLMNYTLGAISEDNFLSRFNSIDEIMDFIDLTIESVLREKYPDSTIIIKDRNYIGYDDEEE